MKRNPSISRTLSLRVANLDCEHEAAILQKKLQSLRGIQQLRIFPATARVDITYDPALLDESIIRKKLDQLGFPPLSGSGIPSPPPPWKNRKVVFSVCAGILLLAGWISGSRLGTSFSLGLYLMAMVIGGYYFVREAVEKLLYQKEVGIELLMALAALAATLLGQPAEGALLVFLYSISEAAEGYTEEKTRSAIKALMKLAPRTAVVKRDGQEQEIPAEAIQVGDVFIVKPGQTVPTDGIVIAGQSSVDESPITGESLPVEKSPGDRVLAGSLNQQGMLEIRATHTFAQNTLSRIIQMVEAAQERKGNSQRFIERFGRWYSPAVLLIAFFIAALPPLLLSADWSTWALRATVFLVAAAPCALVISIPITMVATLGTAARHGVLIKGGIFVEELARVNVVALDKTGTLTRGQPVVTTIQVFDGRLGDRELLQLAAGIESGSEHPLARAIVAAAKQQDLTIPQPQQFRAYPGAGARAVVNDTPYYIGSPTFFQQQQIPLDRTIQAVVEAHQQQGETVVLVGTATQILGCIGLKDRVRSNARTAIQELHRLGIQQVVMLTGDHERTAKAIARELGIDRVFAGLSPEDKCRLVRQLRHESGHLVMVGDGINDAPALAEANVGVAMGAAGTDVAMETADVVLMADDLQKLVYTLQLARRHQRVVRQNLILSSLVIAALVVGAVTGAFHLPVAVLGHELSELAVIASGLRMLRG
ncbi:MAG: cadmium-translocating P-type ATPase [Calditrichaeota bacterium]|nr:cadmium-translocating P-type ATPase [Calditrichota bacterium]